MNTQHNPANIRVSAKHGRRPVLLAARGLLALGLLVLCGANVRAADAPRIRFDIPEKIECRDVTPRNRAGSYPAFKVIEAKFRVSAHFLEGSEADVISFDYVISSHGSRMRVVDYLPNTTLESIYGDDRIEVADFSESTSSDHGEARIGYSVLSFNGGWAQNSKRAEENRYNKIAPKSLVLASGTSHRGHGVFFKLKPSNTASLEGAREFSFLAIVPGNWRGDWCEFTCAARVHKKTMIGMSTASGGIDHAHVGLYLAGDRESSSLATALCELQQADNGLLAKELAKEAAKALEASSTDDCGLSSLLGHKSDGRILYRKPDPNYELLQAVESRLEMRAGGRTFSSRE